MLKFNPEEHLFTFKDRVVPNVTGILSRAGMIQKAWYTEEARDRGSAVHKACHYYDDGVLDMDSIDSEYWPYIEAYQLFLSENKVVWHLIEHYVFDPDLWFAGILDREGIVNKKPYIVDLKTGKPEDWAKLQTMAYKHARATDAGRRVLELKKNGKYKFHPPYENDRDDMLNFKAALTVANWKERNKAWLGG